LSNSGDVLWNFSQEIPKKISGIFLQKFLRISLEFFLAYFLYISLEIPLKFSGLGHQFYGFFGELNQRHNLQIFLRISLEF